MSELATSLQQESDAQDRPIPIGRFDWERIVHSIRWSGVIRPSTGLGKDGRPTRGAVSPTAVRAIADVWAQVADQDGTRVRVGDAKTAVLAECDIKQVKAVKAAFLAYGLLVLVRGGRYAGGGDDYRLTYSPDLHTRLTVLSPDDIDAAAQTIREANRRKRAGSDGPSTADVVQGPTDPVQPDQVDTRTGSDGPAETGRTGSDGTAVQGPMDRCTNHDHPPTPTNPTVDVRTAVTGPRDPAAANKPEFLADGGDVDRLRAAEYTAAAEVHAAEYAERVALGNLADMEGNTAALPADRPTRAQVVAAQVAAAAAGERYEAATRALRDVRHARRRAEADQEQPRGAALAAAILAGRIRPADVPLPADAYDTTPTATVLQFRPRRTA